MMPVSDRLTAMFSLCLSNLVIAHVSKRQDIFIQFA